MEGTGGTQACSMRHSRCVFVWAHDRMFVFRHDAVCMHGVLYMYVLDLCVCVTCMRVWAVLLMYVLHSIGN